MRIVFTKFLKVDDIKQEQKFTLLVSFELGKEIEKMSFFVLSYACDKMKKASFLVSSLLTLISISWESFPLFK